MPRIINLLLVIAICSGLVMFVRQQSQLNTLQAEHDRLGKKYGVLEVKDPKKFYVQRVQTDEESDFLWRVYRPDKLSIAYRTGSSISGQSNGWSTSENGGEFLLRCRLVFTEKNIEIHSIRGGGAGRSNMGDKYLSEFIQKHRDELEIELLADGEYDTQNVMDFVTIRIPDKLVDELIDSENGKRYKRLRGRPFFYSKYGTKKAFEKVDKEEGNS